MRGGRPFALSAPLRRLRPRVLPKLLAAAAGEGLDQADEDGMTAPPATVPPQTCCTKPLRGLPGARSAVLRASRFGGGEGEGGAESSEAG